MFAANRLADSGEQFAALPIPSWVAEVVDDLAAFTAVDDDTRKQLRQAVVALRAGEMNVTDVLSIVYATTPV